MEKSSCLGIARNLCRSPPLVLRFHHPSINVTVLSERTGFSRSYFYRNREAAQLVKQAQKKEEHILKTHAGIVHISEDIEEKLIDLRIEIIRLKQENEILRKKLRDVGYEI